VTVVSTSYTIRVIATEDRAKYARLAEKRRRQGDRDEAVGSKQSQADWEKEQGKERDRLARPI